jgi:hypothetical protein
MLQGAMSATVKPQSLACISVALQHFSGASTAGCAGSCLSDWPLDLGHALELVPYSIKQVKKKYSIHRKKADRQTYTPTLCRWLIVKLLNEGADLQIG